MPDHLRDSPHHTPRRSVAERDDAKSPGHTAMVENARPAASRLVQLATLANALPSNASHLAAEATGGVLQAAAHSAGDGAVIQRITEEDSVQANFTFGPRATAHGLTEVGLTAIMRHRYAEITVGNRQSMLIGQGTEENNGLYGQILYNCRVGQDGVHHIHIFHAHSQGRMG